MPNSSRTEVQEQIVGAHIGALIKTYRRARGLSQLELANAIGQTVQQIQSYETGDEYVTASILFIMSHIFELPMSAFFKGLPKKTTKVSPQNAIARVLGRRSTVELLSAYSVVGPRLQRNILLLIEAMAEDERKNIRHISPERKGS